MKYRGTISLDELMPRRSMAINPAKYPDEVFQLLSIPAFDRNVPDAVLGSAIGSTKQSVRPGDVLLSKIVPHIRRAWVVPPSSQGRRQIASSEWIVFRSPKAYPPYLKHLLIGNFFHAQFMATVAGVGGSLMRARPEHVRAIEIPLPPLDEQRRIAAILDQADSLRAKRRVALAHLDDLARSIFYYTLESDSDHEKSTLLGDLTEISSGITKGRKVGGTQTRSVPYLAVSNVHDRSLSLEVVKNIEATAEEIDRYRLRRGDLVLTEGGDPDKLGRGTVWNEELPLCIHQNHIFRVRIRDSSNLHPTYLANYVASREAKSYFFLSAKQTTGIASINITQLRSLPVRVPSIGVQMEFVTSAERIARQIAVLKAHEQKADALFASLQVRAFSGQL